MKSLLILRHAEAADAFPGQIDNERPLTDRGLRQASALGVYLREQQLLADETSCSSALRAHQTVEALQQAAGSNLNVQFSDAFYNASAEGLLAHVRELPDTAHRTLLVGHAPGVAELVERLCAPRGDLALMFAAATLAEVVADIPHWRDLKPGVGFLRLLLPPAA